MITNYLALKYSINHLNKNNKIFDEIINNFIVNKFINSYKLLLIFIFINIYVYILILIIIIFCIIIKYKKCTDNVYYIENF